MWAAVCGCTPAVMLLPARLKRALACTRKLRTHLGRVIREIERQTEEPSVKLDKLLQTAHRIYAQQKHDKNKIYIVHEPEVLSPGPILALHVVMLSPRAWAPSTANFSENLPSDWSSESSCPLASNSSRRPRRHSTRCLTLPSTRWLATISKYVRVPSD